MIKNILKQENQSPRKAKLFAGSLLFAFLFIFNTNISFAQTTTKKVVKKEIIKSKAVVNKKDVKKVAKKILVKTPAKKSEVNTKSSSTKVLIINNFPTSTNSILKKDFTTSVWVPYWKERDGSAEVLNNLNKIDIISPFSYEMTETGTFKDPMKLGTGPYSEMIKKAKAEGKIIVPSILWWATGQGREDLDFVLRDDDIRGAVIYDIVQVIKKDNLDGIDIDFENKKAESREPFNKFLSELSTELHGMGKVLICTIEARTPIDSKFAGLSAEAYQKKVSEIDYANDFKHIGKVCDQVRIMAYDQQGDDRALNNLRQSDITAYKPVADIDWVEKVLTLAMRDIEWKKIVVGVPTYGYKYEIIRNIEGKITSYKKIGSMNWYYANEEVKNKNIITKRDDGGELSYTYIDSVKNKEYYVVYSDAEAIAQKIKIAKLYKIGGIAIFKVDGNNDKNIWSKI